MPKMFEEANLQVRLGIVIIYQFHWGLIFHHNFKECLAKGQYEFVLDRACAQFEPDDPDYIRVTRKTYDLVDENGQYASLRSTRHFGPMTLHLILSKRMDGLLFHFITSKDVGAAANLVRLFHLVENESSPNDVDEFQLIEVC